MTPSFKYALLYIFFALISGIANLSIQRVVFHFGETKILFLCAILSGTLIGLVLKYTLDKRWIFHDTASGFAREIKKFSVYTCFGALTTTLFWVTEVSFWLLWETSEMREVGAIIGLFFGYFLKYKLDKKFVFTDRKLA